MKRLLPFLILLSAIACVKTPVSDEVYMGYNYYPAEIGSYVIYQVDSVYHDQPNPEIPGVHDTTHFFLKEYFESSFIDNAGRESIRMERYKCDSLGQPWMLSDVWVVTKTPEQVEKVEENVRYVRLAYPVSTGREWNGNILNSKPAWTYSYTNIGNALQVGDTTFSQTVVVEQRDVTNAVEVERASEVYAMDVGLIAKNFTDLDVRISYATNPIAKNIRLGTEYSWTYISHGYE